MTDREAAIRSRLNGLGWEKEIREDAAWLLAELADAREREQTERHAANRLTNELEAAIREPIAPKGSTVWLLERVEELEAELAAAREERDAAKRYFAEANGLLADAREREQALREALQRLVDEPTNLGVSPHAREFARAALAASGGQE